MSQNKDPVATTSTSTEVLEHFSRGKTFHVARRADALSDTPDGSSIADPDTERKKALTALTAEEEKKLIRRIDWRLIPLLALLYVMKKLDESNVSNARIMNKGTPRAILTQLNISSDEYGMITVLYTVPYILAETEAGMFPGIILQLTYWYRPDEMATRLGWIYVCGSIAGIIGGVFAYAFNGVSGRLGVSGWQWLFIFEGATTIVLSALILFRLPDFPSTTSWLSEREKAFIQARLPPNAPRGAEENFSWGEIVTSLKDKRLWLFTLSWALQTCGGSGVKFYQSTIIANLGFSDIATAQLLNIPMSALAIIIIVTCTWLAGKGSIPIPLFPVAFTVIIVACYGVMTAYPSDVGVYIAMMIGNAVSTAWFPLMWPWRAQTTSRATGSAFAIGFVNSYGQVGDAIGPQMFLDKYEPRYQLPFGFSMGLIALCGLNCAYTWWVTRHTERDTRKHKLARLEAKKHNNVVLDDVSDHDLERAGR
ncbi:uncharacterized protein JN550_009908 [Neoarthrinium moseri]|uniref:uncharacterized protein n=1 Tax=Neoarthrinium moseri TaxID=1658444 RepID=UPI001FDB4CCB|nr:uncharacterized protein JN550_009908 [Neoarthrinium moseri]KAI1862761.1 hypothetical protein JN550_009908 [Neoarthrinium moseri]